MATGQKGACHFLAWAMQIFSAPSSNLSSMLPCRQHGQNPLGSWMAAEKTVPTAAALDSHHVSKKLLMCAYALGVKGCLLTE